MDMQTLTTQVKGGIRNRIVRKADHLQDDEALVLACRRGDQTAWETLYQRYKRLIYSIPHHAGLGEDLAAEVFQEVFKQLVEQLDRIEQPARIRAWLVTVARRETLSLIRYGRHANRTVPFADADAGEETDFDDPLDDFADLTPLPDDVLMRLERQHLVHQAVLSLEERCRTLLTLLFYRAETPPYAEIAAALGVSEGSIGPTRARCLEKLRRLLEQAGL
jgi:RNA polymerase sigma factor (sigma-70 family)